MMTTALIKTIRRKHHKSYSDDGANGGCYVNIDVTNHDGVAWLNVGHSCIKMHDKPIHVTWLAELITIAELHDGGIEGFLKANSRSVLGESYALACDPKSPDQIHNDIYID
jgi:hypothetical protein